LTSAYVFPDPAGIVYGERGFLFLPKEREQKLIYFRFQIDVLNIEFYFHFIEIAHYCTGFLALMERHPL
jgi:hypothetical protein